MSSPLQTTLSKAGHPPPQLWSWPGLFSPPWCRVILVHFLSPLSNSKLHEDRALAWLMASSSVSCTVIKPEGWVSPRVNIHEEMDAGESLGFRFCTSPTLHNRVLTNALQCYRWGIWVLDKLNHLLYPYIRLLIAQKMFSRRQVWFICVFSWDAGFPKADENRSDKSGSREVEGQGLTTGFVRALVGLF